MPNLRMENETGFDRAPIRNAKKAPFADYSAA
jgi:hypothetical protein